MDSSSAAGRPKSKTKVSSPPVDADVKAFMDLTQMNERDALETLEKIRLGAKVETPKTREPKQANERQISVNSKVSVSRKAPNGRIVKRTLVPGKVYNVRDYKSDGLHCSFWWQGVLIRVGKFILDKVLK